MRIDPPLGDMYILASEIADRRVSENAALTSVRETPQPDFPRDALHDCARVAVDLVKSNPDHAYYFCRLLLALTEAKQGRGRESPWWFAADLFVEVTRRSLHKKPWGGRLREALHTANLQIGILERRITWLKARGGLLFKRHRDLIAAERAELAETRRAAGWLLAGPYCAELEPDDLSGSLTRWLAPFFVRAGVYSVVTGSGLITAPKGQMAWNGEQGRAMPEPQWALKAAISYLDASLRDAPQELRGSCQIARAQVLPLLARLDPERQDAHWKAAAAAVEEVMQSVAPAKRLDEFYRAVAPTVREIGVQEPKPLEGLLPLTVRELRRQVSGSSFLSLMSDVVAFVEDPGDLRDIWMVIHDVLAEGGELPIPLRVWRHLAHKIPGNRLRCVRTPASFSELITAVEEGCARANLSSSERAATLVHAALHVRAEDVGEVVTLLDTINEVDRDFHTTYEWVLNYLLLDYRKRHAALLEEAGEYDKALLEYFYAAEDTALYADRHDSAGLAAELINRVLPVLEHADQNQDLVDRALKFLMIVEPIVTGMAGAEDYCADFVHNLGQCLAVFLLRVDLSIAMPIVAQQHLLFKGFDFRLLVQNPGLWRQPPSVKHLNELIRAQEERDGPYVPDRLGILDDIEDLPSGTSGFFVVNSREITPASGVEVPLGTLRRAADHAINKSLLFQTYTSKKARRVRPATFEMTERVAHNLDDETVLISLFLTEHDRGDTNDMFTSLTALVSCYVTTQDRKIQIARLGIPGALIRYDLKDKDAAYTLHWTALKVAEVREEINVDPLGSPVTLRGAEALEEHFIKLGGPAPDRLREWRAQGKKHLCFWPHGPLHYVPFHLLHVDGRPLADDWIVTTVGSSAHILPRPKKAVRRRRLLIAGSSRGGAKYKLPIQPQITEHVRNLADQVPGARLLTEGATTPRAVMKALKHVDYVHIAAHGSHDVEAPWYQCLYLDPEADGGDGRLFAHQILGLDLRRVELVTLSACESALGRFDLNDNLRGLPAAFLMAGASTVIGVLWPVTAPVATLFFEELYSCLLAGGSKRDAFRRAQQATRNAYPQYLNWGAFTLIGDWR
ncbi:CHAT domain-containing protein [Streptomyces mexicanus]|uniref:CHAT domain-containing protein n=1 Tax=Streptomyces mexicanus TaxID=178566 RepID=UPI00364A54CE